MSRSYDQSQKRIYDSLWDWHKKIGRIYLNASRILDGYTQIDCLQ